MQDAAPFLSLRNFFVLEILASKFFKLEILASKFVKLELWAPKSFQTKNTGLQVSQTRTM